MGFVPLVRKLLVKKIISIFNFKKFFFKVVYSERSSFMFHDMAFPIEKLAPGVSSFVGMNE